MGPADAVEAFVRGGKLTVVDGRGVPWTFDGSKGKKDKAPAPEGVELAFVLNERLIALDGSGHWWTYNTANSLWAKGNAIDVAKDEATKDEPWTKGPNVEASTVKSEEERHAQAVIDARDAKDAKDKKEAA